MATYAFDPNYPVICARQIVKKYGERIVVSDLSLTVESGQTLGLLGPNGAGKSTTIRMLLGLSRPSSGTIQIFGLDLAAHLKRIHAKIGIVFEKPNLFENLSGFQNLAIFCRLFRKPPALIRPLLERMELWDRAREPVKIYSKGMRQRILILRALIHQPQLLFLDEPCSGLDPVSARIIRDYLLELKSQGITILLTSHDMDEVDTLCDRIGFMNHGKLMVLSDKLQLKAEYGRNLIKICYRDQQLVKEESVAPTIENLVKIHRLYAENRIVSVHSQEATLAEIFRELSSRT